MFRNTFIIVVLFTLLVQSSDGQNSVDRLFILGNSTIDHRPPAIPTPSDETTVPHWVHLLAEEAGHPFSAGGQYGFLSSFDDLNWFSQWGYDLVDGVWESDTEPFGEADITTFMLTTANFIQYQPSDLAYPIDETTTIVEATETIVDHANSMEPGMQYYIYQNWPEMDLQNAFPPNEPSAMEVEDYHNYTSGAFHDWWIEYQDNMLASRPEITIRLLPVGLILSKILRDLIPGQIPFTELYEDSAPHGRATLYFMASLVSYMGMYAEKAPSSFTVPTIVHPAVQNQYQQIVDYIWNELTLFNDDNGNSRVFYENITNTVDLLADEDCITIFPNPVPDHMTLSGQLSDYEIDILDGSGMIYQNLNTSLSLHTIDVSALPAGLYFIRLINVNNGNVMLEKILKD